MTTTGRSTRSTQRSAIADSLASLAQNLSSSSQPIQGTSQSAARASPLPSDYSVIPVPEPENSVPNDNLIPMDPEPEPNPEIAPGPDPVELEPEQESSSSESEDDTPNLAHSLKLLARKISKIPQSKAKAAIKPRSPDTFDGTDPNKLETFVFQVSMYIEACLENFRDGESRVTFALPYLKGIPLKLFQNELSQGLMSGGELPSWFTSYPEFLAELQRLFGPRDPINDATTAIEALRYKDSSKAPRYTLEFNRHARRTGWNDAALARLYYKSLPDRLKDEIARLGKPTTLRELQDLVATLDQRYWERQSEISRDRKPAASSNNKPSDNRTDHRSDHRTNAPQSGASKSNSQQQNSRPKDNKKPFSSNPAASSSSKPAGKSSIADILGPDGKLKPEERQRRMDNKLCLRCGGAGHVAHDCTVQSKSKSKG